MRLLHLCTECKRSLRPDLVSVNSESITYCYSCTYDLHKQKAQTLPDDRTAHRLIRFQQRLLETMDGQPVHRSLFVQQYLRL